MKKKFFFARKFINWKICKMCFGCYVCVRNSKLKIITEKRNFLSVKIFFFDSITNELNRYWNDKNNLKNRFNFTHTINDDDDGKFSIKFRKNSIKMLDGGENDPIENDQIKIFQKISITDWYHWMNLMMVIHEFYIKKIHFIISPKNRYQREYFLIGFFPQFFSLIPLEYPMEIIHSILL